MLQKEFNDRALMLQDDDGQYRPATGAEIIEAAQRTLFSRFAHGTAISAPADVKEVLQLHLACLEHEVFGVVWLDNRHRILAFEELFRGTVDGASVYPREVVKAALQYNAAACILYHNHPSGESNPSGADETITRRLQSALELVGVRTLDHMIVGEQVCSFAEMGLL